MYSVPTRVQKCCVIILMVNIRDEHSSPRFVTLLSTGGEEAGGQSGEFSIVENHNRASNIPENFGQTNQFITNDAGPKKGPSHHFVTCQGLLVNF